MTWTAPTTRTTGDLITASIWNTDVVNNIAYLVARNYDQSTLNLGGDLTTSATSFADADATNLALSITTVQDNEDVDVHFHGTLLLTATYHVYFELDVDGSGEAGDDGIIAKTSPNSAHLLDISFTRKVSIASAGAHTIKLQWKVSNVSATATLYAGAGSASADLHPQFWAEEAEAA